MTDGKSAKDSEVIDSPLVFISHDSRDAELAEAFSKLLKSVSAGMLKSFRSSDKKGTEGIQFGDDWYKRLMTQLSSASDVVCLLTERSIDRPWILYEAGVAKGKLETPVHGVAIGVPLSSVATGPFYQFQNSDDSEDALAKLVLQLCQRIPALEPDMDVVKIQVKTFIQTSNEVLKKLDSPKKTEKKTSGDDSTVAKVLEEMKLMVRELPMRLENKMVDNSENNRLKRPRRIHPMMIDEMSHVISRKKGNKNSIGILVIASLFRNDFPWLYELGMEAYQNIKNDLYEESKESLIIFRDAAEFTFLGPFIEEMGISSKETHMMYREVPMIIDQYLNRICRSSAGKATLIRRRTKTVVNEEDS